VSLLDGGGQLDGKGGVEARGRDQIELDVMTGFMTDEHQSPRLLDGGRRQTEHRNRQRPEKVGEERGVDVEPEVRRPVHPRDREGREAILHVCERRRWHG
jgi:hypothetical protein